jgi:aminopeptidase N
MVKWKNRSVLVTSLVIICALSFSYAQNGDQPRLPKSVIPLHYDLHLVTNIHTGALPFSGHVKIHVHVQEDTNSITLHNRNLKIEKVLLLEYMSRSEIQVDFSPDAQRDFLIIETITRSLRAGEELMLEIEYTGNISNDMIGFYRSQYFVDGENVPR